MKLPNESTSVFYVSISEDIIFCFLLNITNRKKSFEKLRSRKISRSFGAKKLQKAEVKKVPKSFDVKKLQKALMQKSSDVKKKAPGSFAAEIAKKCSDVKKKLEKASTQKSSGKLRFKKKNLSDDTYESSSDYSLADS